MIVHLMLSFLCKYMSVNLSPYVTSQCHPRQLNLAIHLCVGAMSASQRAMMLCGWEWFACG